MTAPYAPRHARPANPPGEARADQWRGRPAGSGAHGIAPDPGGHPYLRPDTCSVAAGEAETPRAGEESRHAPGNLVTVGPGDFIDDEWWWQ